jgi:hypothetical protein
VSEQTVFFVVLGALVCGAVLAVGVLQYVVWLAEREEGRFR